MRARLSGFVVVAVLVSTLVSAADRPPKDLRWTGDHWTAWNPPQPAAGVQTHVIQRGDTLWDLAARFYGDPYLWPQLWERNQYILDAHWIYPGDPLVLGIEVAPVDQLSQQEEAQPAAETGPGDTDNVLTAERAAGEPIPLGGESDIYCTGYIGELEESFPHRIIGSEYESLGANLDLDVSTGFQAKYGRVGTVKYNLSSGDIIYLDGGRAAGLTPGSLFTVVLPERPVTHPVTRQVVGRFYHYAGRVRVLSVQDQGAIAEIVHSCDPILVGAALRPFEAEPVPLGRPTAMRPVNFPTTKERLQTAPVILFSEDNLVSLGEDHVVFIDRGAEQDVTPGDVYTIYRQNQNREDLPPVVIGELAILSVHRNTSVARIMESRYAVYVGDRLDPK